VDHPRLNPAAAHGVYEVRQEMSRWDVENPRAAPSPELHGHNGPYRTKENMMAKYLLLEHYRGAPASVNDVPMDQ